MTCLPSTGQLVRCLRLLEDATEPMPAAAIAAQLQLAGNRESLRRRIREIIRLLREKGSWIVASLSEGYWLTDDETVWRQYNQGQSITAKGRIGMASRRIRASGEADQGLLFGQDALAAR